MPAAFLAIILAIAAVPKGALANPAVVVDVSTGRIIEHREAFQRWYPASLTKLMTMYVVFRALKAGDLALDSPVTMTKHAASEPPSKMYFKAGSQLTLDAAMKIIMVKSANDVAMAIAESVAGTENAFVARMNAEARRIGMRDTRFVNPHGLPGPGQYTTARDMALLGVTLRREFPQYAGYFALEGVKSGKKELRNYNILIGRFRGADGMKTGYICAAGFNQVSTATRGGRTILAVVLGTDSLNARAEESARMLHVGFQSPGRRGGETLWSLAPYGATRATVRDVSEAMCSKEARAARAEDRGESGKLIISSPYIGEMNRPPRLASVGLLPPGGSAGIAVASVPVPSPRPDRLRGAAPATANAFMSVVSSANAADAVKQAAPGIPLPTPRPR